MHEWYPLLIVGAIVGTVTLMFFVAYLLLRAKGEEAGFDRQMGDREIITRLLAYARPYAGRFVLVFFMMLVSIAYSIVSPLIIGGIEELVKSPFEMSALLRMVFGYVGILIVSLVCNYVQAIVLQKTGQRIISHLREDLFVHIESLSHDQFNHTPVGKLVTRVTNDTHAISEAFTGILMQLIKDMLMIVGIVVAMLCLNYLLALMVLSFVPFIIALTVVFRKFSRRANRRVKDGTTDINTFLSENLSGMKITQIFGREEKKTGEFTARNRTLGRAKMQQIFVFSVFRPTVYMLYICSILCLLFLSGMGYVKDMQLLGQTVSSGTLVTFYMYLSNFFDPIQSLADQFNRLQSAFASAEKIFTVMDIPPQIVDAPDAIELEQVRGDIEFSHVWFAYEGEEWILRDVSFRVDARQTVAFVGATGSGKTTILSLICRNYDIQRGQILIDGVDVRHIRIGSLRRHFGQMLQDVFLFSGTVRSNLLLGMEGVSDEEVLQACQYVNADGFISRLKKGLDEEVRERGNNFSAGQRQLLSFARAILHKPSVMILDEATANIDTETEILIQDSLERMRTVGTMLIVAHRLSTIRHADKIIVISDGQVLEEGTHAELLARGGRYYELYTIQSHRESLTGGEAGAVGV